MTFIHIFFKDNVKIEAIFLTSILLHQEDLIIYSRHLYYVSISDRKVSHILCDGNLIRNRGRVVHKNYLILDKGLVSSSYVLVHLDCQCL